MDSTTLLVFGFTKKVFIILFQERFYYVLRSSLS